MQPFVSHLSFAFASRIDCHCMFETASGPPQASGTNVIFNVTGARSASEASARTGGALAGTRA
jgi:hypothetical protein